MSIDFYIPRNRTAPTCNFANTNALNILQLLGYTPDYYGEFQIDQLGNLRQRIIRAMNSNKSRKPYIEEAYSTNRFHYGGNTDEQTLHRLQDLLTLVIYAQKNNQPIQWS